MKMRAFLILLAFLIMTSSQTLAAGNDDKDAPPLGTSSTGPAPADEYFGRLKMSILGIRNQLTHLTAQAEENPADGDGMLAATMLTEESVKEWEQHYPRDPWLAKTVYAIVHVYAKIPGESAHASAVRTLAWLLSKYPESEYTSAAVQEVGQATCRR